MRTIPIFLFGFGLLAACTTEPKNRPYYGPAPVCQETCEKDSDCDGLVCCLNKEDCGADHQCVECKSNAQCGDGVCFAGTCVECVGDADCKGNANGPHCTPYNTCAECADDRHCQNAEAGSRCGDDFTCKCDTDKDCKEPGFGLCRAEGCVCSDDSACPNGPKDCQHGVCVVCSTDEHCQELVDDDPTTPDKTKCFAPGTVSAFCGCADDSQCEEGTFCNVETGQCVACTKNEHCTEPGANVCIDAGKPTAACGCDVETKCPDGRKCVSPGATGAFCGCTKDSHCPDDEVCNAATGLCQQCVKDADCKALKLGSVCTEEGTCSCTADSECKAKTSAPGLGWVCE